MIEKTLVILKPDCVQRGICGEILARFEKVGMKIVGIKMIYATKAQLEDHYYKDDQWLIEKGKMLIQKKGYPNSYDPKKAGKEIIDGLLDDMMICPIIVMALEGHNAVGVVKKLTGPTNIEEALPGTIRGDYSHDTYTLANISDRPILTIIHASGNSEDAKRELPIWFSSEELHGYEKIDHQIHYRKGKNA